MTGLCDRDGWFNAFLLCAGFEQETTTLPCTQDRPLGADIQMTSWCLVVLEAGECLGVVILGVDSLEPEQRHTPFSGVMRGSWEDPELTTVWLQRDATFGWTQVPTHKTFHFLWLCLEQSDREANPVVSWVCVQGPNPCCLSLAAMFEGTHSFLQTSPVWWKSV